LRLFLDTSVLLAASGSARGASREIFRLASHNDWSLIATPYVVEEVLTNLGELTPSSEWAKLRQHLIILDDVLTLDRPVVFSPAKDRPILFSALAWADVLLTLDRADFGEALGHTIRTKRSSRPCLVGNRSGTAQFVHAMRQRVGPGWLASARPDEIHERSKAERIVRGGLMTTQLPAASAGASEG
jgi:PIN domain